RLAVSTRREARRGRRGEAVAVIGTPSLATAVKELHAATAAASASPVRSLEPQDSMEEALSELDDALPEHATVLVVAEVGDGRLQVLEEAGYVVDAVGGASIGALVGAYLALGMSAAEIDHTLREAFTPEVVADVFTLSLGGQSTGTEVMERIFRETTGERSFEDTVIPLVCMAVDLTERTSAPIR